MIVSSFRGMGAGAPEPIPASRPLKPGCAIAVCTYRRARSLARFLDSLLRQAPAPDHQIIVDASPDPDTEEFVRGRMEAVHRQYGEWWALAYGFGINTVPRRRGGGCREGRRRLVELEVTGPMGECTPRILAALEQIGR